MDKFAAGIVKHKKPVVIVFIVLTLITGVLSLGVGINYKLVDYLPQGAGSTKALSIMDDEFESDIPNAYVMMSDVDLEEALKYKAELLNLEGVLDVVWIDDVVDIKEPLEFMDEDVVETYYKDGNAQFSLVIDEDKDKETVEEIYEIIGDETEGNALTGSAVSDELQKRLAESETLRTMIFVVPVAILILIISTTSWLEPFLFLAAIGVAVIINMGTNLFFGDVSYITNSVSPILQLAVSLDYAIFLLHSFERHRKEWVPDEAMTFAIKDSFSAIIASATTTLFGFAALSFMEFGIGADLGINLVKGIIFSFVSVVVLLPALTLYLYKFIDKTRHKNVFPKFEGFSREIQKIKIPALVIMILIIIPSFLAQNNNNFLYGNEALSDSSRLGADERLVESTFGRNTPIVLLVPKGEPAKEKLLSEEISDKYPEVTSVVSYATAVGVSIPPEYLDENIVQQFYSENYSRIIVNADTNKEGEEVFSLVENIIANADGYYEDGVYALGESVALYDIKDSITSDSTKVSLIAIIAIMLVILFSFRSLTFPILLVFVIQGAIWINLSIPYFMGSDINYIGYLIISTVQLGATVDYAIILSDTYVKRRRLYEKKRATWLTLTDATGSIFVSGTILASAGFVLNVVSTSPIISELGILLCRGTILSMVLVIVVLPALLNVFDKLIAKTTIKSGFLYGGEDK